MLGAQTFGRPSEGAIGSPVVSPGSYVLPEPAVN